MFTGKALRCDCGYDVRADDDAFVEAIRRHAWEAHGIEFSVELALDVARSARQAPSEHDELEHNRVSRKEK
jgi:predicted small metal-binding protein